MIDIAEQDGSHSLRHQWNSIPTPMSEPIYLRSVHVKDALVFDAIIRTSEPNQRYDHYRRNVENNWDNSHDCYFLEQTNIFLKGEYQGQQKASQVESYSV